MQYRLNCYSIPQLTNLKLKFGLIDFLHIFMNFVVFFFVNNFVKDLYIIFMSV